MRTTTGASAARTPAATNAAIRRRRISSSDRIRPATDVGSIENLQPEENAGDGRLPAKAGSHANCACRLVSPDLYVASAFRRKIEQGTGQTPQRGGGQERIQRRLEDDDLVEGELTRQRGERRRDPRGAPAEPGVCGPEHARHRGGAECNLHDAHDGERIRQPEQRREDVDVERRDVVEARPEPEIAAQHAAREADVGRRVERPLGLEQRMVLEPQQHHELYQEDRGQERRQPPVPFRSRRGRREAPLPLFLPRRRHARQPLYNKKRTRVEPRVRSTWQVNP